MSSQFVIKHRSLGFAAASDIGFRDTVCDTTLKFPSREDAEIFIQTFQEAFEDCSIEEVFGL